MVRSLASCVVVTAFVISASIASGQRIEEVVAGLEQPCDIAADPTHDGRYYILEQDGVVRIVEDGRLMEKPFAEVDRADFTGPDSNWERGLLGIAFDPGYAENDRLYLYYTDVSGATVLSRFTAEDAYTLDWNTEERLLRIEQPWGNHNGGCIRFGPDGMLYVGPGDGGAANDPRNLAQDTSDLLGKMLRIDVTGEPDNGKPYAIPDDNPFVGDDDARPEVWAYGARNPWRFTWDSKGRLFIADVGQNRFEWVHVLPPGSKGDNLGWKIMEGLGEFRPGRRRSQDPPRLERAEIAERGIRPAVFEYRHHPVASITGGYFYEGDTYDWLEDRYICADFMSGRIWTFELVEETADDEGGVQRWYAADDIVEITRRVEASYGGSMRGSISSFGRSNDGETLYILDHSGGRLLRFAE